MEKKSFWRILKHSWNEHSENIWRGSKASSVVKSSVGIPPLKWKDENIYKQIGLPVEEGEHLEGELEESRFHSSEEINKINIYIVEPLMI